MERLPKELLCQVFDHLTRYYQRKCQQVCRSWCEAILLCLNDSKQMHGYAGIRETSQTITSSSGRNIHQLMFMTDIGSYTRPPITDEEFLALLLKTPNLRVLNFVNVNPIYFLTYLKENPIVLNKLEFISVPRTNWSETAICYFNVAYMHRKTINCLKMEVSRINNALFPMFINFLFFLRDFPNLCVLGICTYDTLYLELDSILDTCPQLEELSIEGPFTTTRNLPLLQLSTPTSTTLLKYVLNSLKVDIKQVDQTFLSFVIKKMSCLDRLCLCGKGANDSTGFFEYLWYLDLYKFNMKSLTFMNGEWPLFFNLTGITNHFINLTEINFKGVDLNNVLLNFMNLNLTCITIDVAPFLTANICVQIYLFDNQGKCTFHTHRCFEPESLVSTASQAMDKFVSLSGTSSLTIITQQTLRFIHMYYNSDFTQNMLVQRDART